MSTHYTSNVDKINSVKCCVGCTRKYWKNQLISVVWRRARYHRQNPMDNWPFRCQPESPDTWNGRINVVIDWKRTLSVSAALFSVPLPHAANGFWLIAIVWHTPMRTHFICSNFAFRTSQDCHAFSLDCSVRHWFHQIIRALPNVIVSKKLICTKNKKEIRRFIKLKSISAPFYDTTHDSRNISSKHKMKNL